MYIYIHMHNYNYNYIYIYIYILGIFSTGRQAAQEGSGAAERAGPSRGSICFALFLSLLWLLRLSLLLSHRFACWFDLLYDYCLVLYDYWFAC